MINITIPEFSEAMDKDQVKSIGAKAGVYVLMDKDKKEIYVGKSIDLSNRLNVHFKRRKKEIMKPYVKYFKYFEVTNLVDLEIYETYLINLLQPPFNSSKVYTYSAYKKNARLS